ncbi:NAC domain containing protein, putative [Eimeria tenella]|uniref:Nascent polypeptide-associated complex subunit beta n=1 Tax=Eimeria tenella TaxID=5802 RepID=U6KP59_EIMTE|nr:NAC domain containing protein, putative [Eimeria tenella]CDJ38062.1 NAC domain containing protein, putative [Eimeria tenella]|eukprot:XP_013228900.1 NAC domain containing protein, putative [Eimeria tenella]
MTMEEEVSPAVAAARAKLRERLGQQTQQLGGKGTARRKAAKSHRSAVGEDKRLQQAAKKVGAAAVYGIEEAYLLRKDATGLFFKTPKVLAAPAANTYILSGAVEEKQQLEPLLHARGAAAAAAAADGPAVTSEMLKQLQQHVQKFSKQNQQQQQQQQQQEADDDVPDLVQNFEEVSKQ